MFSIVSDSECELVCLDVFLYLIVVRLIFVLVCVCLDVFLYQIVVLVCVFTCVFVSDNCASVCLVVSVVGWRCSHWSCGCNSLLVSDRRGRVES